MMDVDKSGTLDLQEFTAAVQELRLDVAQEDIFCLFDCFDRNRNRVIDYQEFMETIRGTLPQHRFTLVEKAFQSVDPLLKGSVDIRDIKRAYNARQHPLVLEGRMSE